MTVFFAIACVVAALLGAPLFAVMFLGTAVAYGSLEFPIDLVNSIVMMGDLADKPFLLPIPLFTFAGYLMARSRTPQRLVALAEAFFGWMPGGVAIVSVLTCAFFTTFTGASGVTIIALGGLLYPILLRRQYPEPFALGLMTSSGSIGLLFFPALPVFIFATVYSLSTGGASVVEPGELFLGGLLPGLLLVGLLCAYSMFIGVKHQIERTPFAWGPAVAAVKDSWGELLLPVVILGFLQTGKVSINEIASLTVVYVFVLEVVIYRDIHWRTDLGKVIRESMMLVGAIAVILAVILGMNNFLTHAQIPQAILESMRSWITSKVVFLLVLNGFLLIIGCLMDIFSATVAVLPLIIPLALDFGVDPVHLGIVFLANLEIGYMTPPVGMNLFIASFQFKRPVLSVYRAVLPFIGLLAAALLVITYVPALSTWLPSVFLGPRPAVGGGDGGTDSELGSEPEGEPGADGEREQNLLKLLDDDDDLEALLDDDDGDGDEAGEEDLKAPLEEGGDEDSGEEAQEQGEESDPAL